MTRQERRPSMDSRAAHKISSANQIKIQGTTSDEAVRCIRCNRELTSPRSIPHRAGRLCRHLLQQGVAA